MKKITVGILALQGCIDPHVPHLKALGANLINVKFIEECDKVDAYILPGGESTTMLKLMDNFSLKEKLARDFRRKPVWGICAGAILMAQDLENCCQESFKLMDIKIKRNGYGRQLDSKEEMINKYPVCFIRAPIVTTIGPEVKVVYESKGHFLWLEEGKYMMTTFHPELTNIFPSPMHSYFLRKIKLHLEKNGNL